MDWLKLIFTAPATGDIAALILVVAMLAWIIYLLVKNRQGVAEVSSNHLSGLPEMQDGIKKLVILTEQQNRLLAKMNDDIVYLRARSNGWNGR